MVGVHEKRWIGVGEDRVAVDVWNVAFPSKLPIVRFQRLDATVGNNRRRHRAIDKEDVDSASRGDLDEMIQSCQLVRIRAARQFITDSKIHEVGWIHPWSDFLGRTSIREMLQKQAVHRLGQ